MANDVKTTYRRIGHNGKAYIIEERFGEMPIFIYNGFIRGNVMYLYPSRSLCKGERRDKLTISVSQIGNV